MYLVVAGRMREEDGMRLPEESDGQQGRLDAGEVEATFGRLLGVGIVFDGDLLAVDGDDGGDNGCDAEGRKDGAGLLEIEVVVCLVD